MFRNPTADLIVVLVIVLLIFGPKRLPGLGKSLGHGIREFKDGITGKSTRTTSDRASARTDRRVRDSASRHNRARRGRSRVARAPLVAALRERATWRRSFGPSGTKIV